jgi:3-oxoacyl-[acyl-carrier protein] reductase
MEKVVVVTGSAKGIGASCIKKFASLNYNVVIHYNTSKKEAYNLKEEVEKTYQVKALCVEGNLEKEEDINNIIKQIKEHFDHIDVLVNNAAYCFDTLYEQKTKEKFLKTIDVNVVGPFLLSKGLEDLLIKSKGCIINIASTNGIDTYFPMCLDYDASKAALISLTHNLALQYAPYVRVNAVAPGFIETEAEIKDMDEEFISSEEKKIFIKRIGKPEEVASVVAFLASSEASYINNTVIRVDGGHYS